MVDCFFSFVAAIMRKVSLTYYIAVIGYYLLFSFSYLYWIFGDKLMQLNQWQWDRSGDGFKNFYTFAYHYKNGSGSWFDGFLYPFGEYLPYTDAQPALLFVLKILKAIGLDLTGHELLLVQVFPLASVFIAALCLHAIMKLFDQNTLWTLLTVSACIALSPQLFRLQNHFGLAYLSIIPMAWLLAVLYDLGKLTFQVSTFIMVPFMVFAGFLHPYMLIMTAMFILGVYVCGLLYGRYKPAYLIWPMLSLLIFLAINHILDPVTDRPSNPWGVWRYKTEVSDMLPFFGWFKNTFEGVFSIRTTITEGYCYPGILIFIVPLLGLVQSARRRKVFTSGNAAFIKPYILAALLVLLFAMGIHMLVTGKAILEWVPVLAQFRGVGRFSWVFYYVGFIYFSMYFYQFATRLNSRIGVILLLLVSVLWCMDVFSFSDVLQKKINRFASHNLLVENRGIKDVLGEANIDPTSFQAIMALPTNTEGCEKILAGDDWLVKTETMPLAYQTGLPLTSLYMSRTSISRTLMTNQLSSSNFVEKEAFQFIESEKPFLTVVNALDTSLFSDILGYSAPLGAYKELLIYMTPVDKLRQVRHFEEDMPEDSVSSRFVYRGFEDKASQGLFSKGSLFVEEGSVEIMSISTDTFPVDGNLDFSIWYRIQPDKSTIPAFDVLCVDEAGRQIKHLSYRDFQFRRFEISQDWLRIRRRIEIPKETRLMHWTVDVQNLMLDHAVISDTMGRFLIRLEENRVLSNHFIKRTK